MLQIHSAAFTPERLSLLFSRKDARQVSLRRQLITQSLSWT
jgi:hypothetical protein